jgi:hypothetical protein
MLGTMTLEQHHPITGTEGGDDREHASSQIYQACPGVCGPLFLFAAENTKTNSIHQTRINSQDHPLATMKGKKEDPNAQPRRGSQPKAPTGLSDETAVETHDLIHRAEEEEQKVRMGC